MEALMLNSLTKGVEIELFCPLNQRPNSLLYNASTVPKKIKPPKYLILRKLPFWIIFAENKNDRYFNIKLSR